MNQKNKKWIALLTMCSALCFTSSSWGANIFWNGGVGNWTNAASWGGTVPGSADTAFINQNNAVVTLDTTNNTVTGINIANNGGSATSSMLIDTGGSLTVTGTGNNLWIAQQGNASPTGTLTVKGTLNYNGVVRMSSFQNAGTSAKSSLIIDGGTVFIDNQIDMGGGSSTNISTTLTLTNGGTISGLNSIATGIGTNTFNLSTISTGIDVIDMSSAFTLGGGINILNVDLSSYDIMSGTNISLFSYATRSGSWSSVNIAGANLGSIALGTSTNYSFDTGLWKGDLVVSSGGLSLQLVPEPSTYALLALAAAGLGAHVVRRRKR